MNRISSSAAVVLCGLKSIASGCFHISQILFLQKRFDHYCLGFCFRVGHTLKWPRHAGEQVVNHFLCTISAVSMAGAAARMGLEACREHIAQCAPAGGQVVDHFKELLRSLYHYCTLLRILPCIVRIRAFPLGIRASICDFTN